jgi:hypothetical protein
VDEGLVTREGVARDYGGAGAPSTDATAAAPPLTAFSPAERLGAVRPAPSDDDFAARARTALASVEEGYCRSRCPLAADPRRCPHYHAEALRFWPASALRRWTARHCPIAERLLDTLPT